MGMNSASTVELASGATGVVVSAHVSVQLTPVGGPFSQQWLNSIAVHVERSINNSTFTELTVLGTTITETKSYINTLMYTDTTAVSGTRYYYRLKVVTDYTETVGTPE